MSIKLIIDTVTSKPDANKNRYHFAIFTPTDHPEKAFACETWDSTRGLSMAAHAGIPAKNIHITDSTIGKREWLRLTSKRVKVRDRMHQTRPVRWIDYKDLPEILAEIFTPEVT